MIMSKTGPQKFEFSRSFESDGSVNECSGNWRSSIPREEVEALEAEAFDRGRDNEIVRVDQETQVVIKNIDAQLLQILTKHSEIAEQNSKDAAFLVHTIAGKIAGAALGKFEIEQVSSLVTQTLSDLKGAPRVKIKVTAAVADKLKEQLSILIEGSEFLGSVIIEIDEAASTGSVSLDWGEGAVSFDPVEIETRIQQEITNWLSVVENSAPSTQILEEGSDHVG